MRKGRFGLRGPLPRSGRGGHWTRLLFLSTAYAEIDQHERVRPVKKERTDLDKHGDFSEPSSHGLAKRIGSGHRPRTKNTGCAPFPEKRGGGAAAVPRNQTLSGHQ